MIQLLNGQQIEVRRISGASPDAPTVVLLHEGLGSVAHWKDFPERLADATGASVFLYSRQGHGASSAITRARSVRYLHEEAEIALPAVLEQAAIRMPVLLGHSDGASIAILYASTHPARVEGLILEAPHVVVEPVGVAAIAAAKVAYQTTDLRQKLARYHRDPDSLFRAWNDIWLDPAFREWNIEAALDTIRCPVLLIQGEDDEYGTVEQLDRIRARLPWAETVLFADCRHAPHRDQTELTLERIARFLEALR